VPEGDTIHKTAASLHGALAGRSLIAFRTTGVASGPVRRRPDPGTVVERVEARGKHLLMRFGDGTVLHTHLGMHGSWHLYRPGERWLRGPARVRAVVEVPGATAVCFAPAVVEVLSDREVERHPRIAGLGPDLAADDPDLDEAVARARRVPATTPVASVLLDQRVAAGIGNVYKTEVLFALGVDPFASVGSFDDDAIRGLLKTASSMLRANAVRRGPRTTSREGLAVYGRTGRPCPRCWTPVRSIVHGHERRRTYWCPACQAPGTARTAS
jgi:endonuclease VIII